MERVLDCALAGGLAVSFAQHLLCLGWREIEIVRGAIPADAATHQLVENHANENEIDSDHD